MNQLHSRMIVDMGDGESPMSFCSRMAQVFSRTARDFCLDMGFKFQAIVDGDPKALQAVATRCRADLDRLTMASIVKVADRRYRLHDQDLVRDTLSRATMRACPHCLTEDMDMGKGADALRPYGRTKWLVAPIRTCLRHKTALVEVASDDNPHRVHDFAQLIGPSLQQMPDFLRKSQERRPSALENHLFDRLSHPADATAWLQRLPFYAAAKVCEVLGAVETHGIRFRANGLTDYDWHEAGAVGFEIANSGEPGIRSLLSRLQETFALSKNDWGPRSIFGRLYEWLAHESDDFAYDPLREIITNHVTETMPVGPGYDIFGVKLQTRRLHSVRSASLELGAHPKRLRKLLHAAGHISSESITLTDDRIVFDATTTQDFLERVAGAMSLKEVGQYINAPRPHEHLLYEAGFIKPFVRGGTETLKVHAFAKQDLDAFLARLLAHATNAGPDDNSMPTIPDAAKRANCAAAEIVQLIFDRKLSRVRRRADEFGYLSVLVDPDEVKHHVRGPELQGLTLRAVERNLRASSAAVKALISSNHLTSGMMLNPVNRCPQRYVREADLHDFMAKFASIDTLARELGTRRKPIRSKLDALDIVPAFVLSEVDLPFYDRRTIAKKFSKR